MTRGLFRVAALLAFATSMLAQDKTNQHTEAETRTPNGLLGKALGEFADVKAPLPSDETKPGIIVRSFSKLPSVTTYTGEFGLSQAGASPGQGTFKLKRADMTFVRVILDISLESIPRVLWKDKIELLVDDEKAAVAFELVVQHSPDASLYALDGCKLTKRHNRVAITFPVKDADVDKMVLRVDGKSYGSLKGLMPAKD